MILEAMLACWIARRIDGENPPEQSVPNPTYIATATVSARSKGEDGDRDQP